MYLKKLWATDITRMKGLSSSDSLADSPLALPLGPALSRRTDTADAGRRAPALASPGNLASGYVFISDVCTRISLLVWKQIDTCMNMETGIHAYKERVGRRRDR